MKGSYKLKFRNRDSLDVSDCDMQFDDVKVKFQGADVFIIAPWTSIQYIKETKQ